VHLRLYRPSQNLGCPGLRIGNFYADLYPRWNSWLPGLFVFTGSARYWITPFRIRKGR
jgi:hypothetical protein